MIGPNAKGIHVGGYSSVKPPKVVDVLEGITAKAGAGVKVARRGREDHRERYQLVERQGRPADPVKNRARIAAALPVAKGADAVVLVLGTSESTSRADRTSATRPTSCLTSQQQELVDAVVALGKPTVAVLIHGRPLAIPQLAEKVPAILDAGTWARRAAPPSARSSSATSTRAASCR